MKIILIVFLLIILSGCDLNSGDKVTVTTFAGRVGDPGWRNGTGEIAQFDHPYALVLDSAGNLYVSETGNFRIRKITPEGVVSDFVGRGRGYLDHAQGLMAQFDEIRGLAFCPDENYLYISDCHNNRIRRVDMRDPDRAVDTIAGDGTAGFANGIGTSAQFQFPHAIAVDSRGNIFVADNFSNRIRKIEVGTWVVTTFAGGDNSDDTTGDGFPDSKGFANGYSTAARFREPLGIIIDENDYIIVADTWNHCFRMITPRGRVSVYASFRGSWGFLDGDSSSARVGNPEAMAIDSFGTIYFLDDFSQSVRKITRGRLVDGRSPPNMPHISVQPRLAGRVITTVAGVAQWVPNRVGGFRNGTGVEARFNNPKGIAVSPDGRTIFVADTQNHVIRKITIE